MRSSHGDYKILNTITEDVLAIVCIYSLQYSVCSIVRLPAVYRPYFMRSVMSAGTLCIRKFRQIRLLSVQPVIVQIHRC